MLSSIIILIEKDDNAFIFLFHGQLQKTCFLYNNMNRSEL